MICKECGQEKPNEAEILMDIIRESHKDAPLNSHIKNEDCKTNPIGCALIDSILLHFTLKDKKRV